MHLYKYVWNYMIIYVQQLKYTQIWYPTSCREYCEWMLDIKILDKKNYYICSSVCWVDSAPKSSQDLSLNNAKNCLCDFFIIL